jgi:hypothetical protein
MYFGGTKTKAKKGLIAKTHSIRDGILRRAAVPVAS